MVAHRTSLGGVAAGEAPWVVPSPDVLAAAFALSSATASQLVREPHKGSFASLWSAILRSGA